MLIDPYQATDVAGMLQKRIGKLLPGLRYTLHYQFAQLVQIALQQVQGRQHDDIENAEFGEGLRPGLRWWAPKYFSQTC